MIIERQGAIYILLCILWNSIHQYALHHHLNIKYIHQQRFLLPPSKLPASGENNRSPASGKVGTIEMPWQLRLEMVGSDVEVIQLAFKWVGHQFQVTVMVFGGSNATLLYVEWLWQLYTSLWLGLTELLHSTPLGCLTRAPSERCVPGSNLQIFPCSH